jgi:hypothetical protein
MTQSNREERVFWVGLAALLLVGIFLGVRAERGVRVVLSAQSGQSGGGTTVTADAEGQAMRVLLTELDAKSARIEQAPAADRDPFREPAPKLLAQTAPVPATPRPTPKPPPRVKPSLGALLYDEVNPSVQLRVGTLTSDWLHRGENFKDWTVVEIRPGAVTVSQDGDTVVLRPS